MPFWWSGLKQLICEYHVNIFCFLVFSTVGSTYCNCSKTTLLQNSPYFCYHKGPPCSWAAVHLETFSQEVSQCLWSGSVAWIVASSRDRLGSLPKYTWYLHDKLVWYRNDAWESKQRSFFNSRHINDSWRHQQPPSITTGLDRDGAILLSQLVEKSLDQKNQRWLNWERRPRPEISMNLKSKCSSNRIWQLTLMGVRHHCYPLILEIYCVICTHV